MMRLKRFVLISVTNYLHFTAIINEEKSWFHSNFILLELEAYQVRYIAEEVGHFIKFFTLLIKHPVSDKSDDGRYSPVSMTKSRWCLMLSSAVSIWPTTLNLLIILVDTELNNNTDEQLAVAKNY